MPEVVEWPFSGKRVYAAWSGAVADLEGALATLTPQIKILSGWLRESAAFAGAGARLANRPFVRLAPASGAGFAKLAEQTVRSVATGVTGVAVIQAALAGIGFFAAGVPGAAFRVLICLLLGVVQLPLTLIMVPVWIWVWSSTPTLTAVLFTA